LQLFSLIHHGVFFSVCRPHLLIIGLCSALEKTGKDVIVAFDGCSFQFAQRPTASQKQLASWTRLDSELLGFTLEHSGSFQIFLSSRELAALIHSTVGMASARIELHHHKDVYILRILCRSTAATEAEARNLRLGLPGVLFYELAVCPDEQPITEPSLGHPIYSFQLSSLQSLSRSLARLAKISPSILLKLIREGDQWSLKLEAISPMMSVNLKFTVFPLNDPVRDEQISVTILADSFLRSLHLAVHYAGVGRVICGLIPGSMLVVSHCLLDEEASNSLSFYIPALSLSLL